MSDSRFMPHCHRPWVSVLDRPRNGRWQLAWLGLVFVCHVHAAPTILTQPQSQTNAVGSSVTFSVSTTNSGTHTVGFNYGDLDGWPHTNVFYTGRTAGTLNFSYVFGSLNDRMTVYYGGSQIYDTGYVGGPNTRTFTVGYGPGTDTSVTVIINEGNYNIHGSKWEYHLSMLPPISYQWQFNGTNFPGFTNAACSLTNISTTNAGNYRVKVVDQSGAITSAVATLTVVVPPAFTQQPVGLTVLAGSSSNLSVITTGAAPLSYQWQRNGTNLSGATLPVYTFTNAQAADAGNYSVVVTNTGGSITSTPVLLKVLISPALTSVLNSSTNFGFSYATVLGSTYVVEYKTNLTDAIWIQAATNAGSGSLTNYLSNTTGVPRRFFRVLVR